jgi:osmoprotectant transport system ATP-binding protein
MIELSQVCKQYQARAVLQHVTLTLPASQTHVLLGASGCGKTTLLRLIAGTTAPDSGTVVIDGTPVVVADPCPLAAQVGYMTQEGGLFPHLTAEQNVTLMARVRNMPKHEQQRRLDELSTLVELSGEHLSRYPSQLSGGQRQRVALIRALFQRPKYLLLDEPMAALDPIMRRELQTTLKQIFGGLRTTVILVTHDVGEAAFFGDTITLLHQGMVLQHGSFSDLVRRPLHPHVSAFLQAQRPVPQLGELSE